MKITTPKFAYRFFKARLKSDVEEFWAAALNSDKKVVAAACLFRGTADKCIFHPRDVFRFAMLHNATSIVVAHNHPSGNVHPSDADILVTGQLLRAALIMELPVVDHLIMGKRSYYSFLENGRLTCPAEPVYPERSLC